MNNNNETTNINPENINVGNLGTKPVIKYSWKTGTPIIIDTIRNSKPIKEKKMDGL